jgi:hypothetical protein
MQMRWFVRLLAEVVGPARTLTGAMLVVAACAGPAWAQASEVPAAPEIDPGSIASALTLAIGGALMLTDRWRNKQ